MFKFLRRLFRSDWPSHPWVVVESNLKPPPDGYYCTPHLRIRVEGHPSRPDGPLVRAYRLQQLWHPGVAGSDKKSVWVDVPAAFGRDE